MKGWNWKRIACAAGGAVLWGVSRVVPPLAWLEHPAEVLIGVSIRTPGHVPAPTNPHDEITEVLTREK